MNAALRRQLLASALLGLLMLVLVKIPEAYETYAVIFAMVAGFFVITTASGQGGESRRALSELLADWRESASRQETLTHEASTLLDDTRGELERLFTDLGQLGEEIARTGELTAQLTGVPLERAIRELSSDWPHNEQAIGTMAAKVREVARDLEALATATEHTASAVEAIDHSALQVQAGADETARLSERVAADADTGALALSKTLSEIDRIKESSLEAVSVISTLGLRIEAIGQVVNVIDDVAEQTNLLALNAAIIAAQAGEQGKGFAVVADEIKDLAERAATSTREITELIKTVQAESKNAVLAAERGAINIDRGIEISREAERALEKILESSQKSQSSVRAIAEATALHASGSKQVSESIAGIAQTVQHLAEVAHGQVQAVEPLTKGAARVRELTSEAQEASAALHQQGHAAKGALEALGHRSDRLDDWQESSQRKLRELTARCEELEKLGKRQQKQRERLAKALE